MSPVNRTAKRERMVRVALADGKLSPEAAAEQLAKLKALGPRFVATWRLPSGEERTQTFKTERAAAAFEAEQKALVRLGAAQDPQRVRATLADVLAFHLDEKMIRDGKPRASFKNVRAIGKNILAIWGDRFTLEQLDADPEKHLRSLRKALEARFGVYTAWNQKVTLRAALAYWIRRKRLRLLNPVDAYDWPKPDNRRTARISWEMHVRFLSEAHKLHGIWLAAYLECGWETGWRAGEILDWHAERFNFQPAGEDFPTVKTLVEKRGALEPVYEEKPISFRVAELVQAVLGGRTSGPVWPLGRTQTDRMVRRAMDQAGGQAYRFHDYRRSMKKRMEEAGVSAAAGAAYTGHGEDMHARYNVQLLADMHGVLRKLEAIRT